MTARPRRFLPLAAGMLLGPLLLAGCSHGKPAQAQAPAAAPAAGYAAVARGRIDVEGGLLNLAAPRDGTLARLDVREGEHVKRGQPLAQLDTAPAQLALVGAQVELGQRLRVLGLRAPLDAQVTNVRGQPGASVSTQSG
uniref:HlyD family efflux transporter periplasmic adaptor subunit n=1 Tax=Frateuria defendens TaxID=2219559 RepID=UPI000AEED37F